MPRYIYIFCLVILVLIIIIVCALKAQNSVEDTLKLVHVIFRHGNRTPDPRMLYRNDPHANNTYYPYGYGQLTNKGKNTMYLVGKALRERYDEFLGSLYKPDLLDPVSSDWNRTKMSLELVLAGLFPPKDTDMEWQRELNWQPIPYNYLPLTSYHGLTIPFVFCPKYISLLQSLEKSPAGLAFHKKHAQLYQYLEKHTGLENVSSLKILMLYSTLVAQDDFDLTLPPWTQAVYPKQLDEYTGDFFLYATSTENLKRLTGGILLKKIIQDSVAKVDNSMKPANRKMFLYSANNIHLAYILSAMNVYFPHEPPYGSYVLVEVHIINNVPGVKIFYQDYTSKEPRLLMVPGCDYFCPLDDFFRLLKDHLPVSDEQCKTNSTISEFEESKDVVP